MHYTDSQRLPLHFPKEYNVGLKFVSPELGLKLRLGKAYGDERLEAACRRALTAGSCRYKSGETVEIMAIIGQQDLEGWL